MTTRGRLWQQRDRSRIDQTLRLATAAGLSFAIAASLYVENAYWAAMPVWVVTQATRGVLLGRAAYRIAGTLCGASLGFGVLHLPVPEPVPLLLAALAIGLCAGASHLQPGVSAYGSMMAAITTAVVVVPSALDPSASMHLAVERVECTLIGVVVTTLVMAFWTPPSAREQFYRSVRQLAGNALELAGRVVAHASDRTDIERRILIEFGELEARSALVVASSRDGRQRQRHVDALVVATLEAMAAAYALAAQVRRGFRVPEALTAELAAASASTPTGAAGCFSEPAESPEREATAPHAHPAALRLSHAIERITQAERELFSRQGDAAAQGGEPAPLDAPRDWALAWQTALTTGVVALLAVNLVHVLATPLIVPMAMALCIFSIVLGSLPLPQQIAPVLFAGVCAGVLASIVYRLGLQPLAATPALLVLSVLPFILVGAFARTYLRTALAAIDANMCFMLASQAGRPAAPAEVVWVESATMLLGTAIVSSGYLLLPRLPHKRAAAAAQNIRRDLERLLDAAPASVWQPRVHRQILRLMVHLGRAGQFGEQIPRSLLAALNLGHAIVLLKGQALTGDETARRALRALRSFATQPRRVAAVLLRLADSADAGTHTPLHMTADALTNCEDLLRLAGGLTPSPGHRPDRRMQ
ncbi:FUSC family protein [Erwinia sp. S43]|uniref:FUSC family protein n=1 Tax=Erwinia sp. S43 TaxID=2769339 RepID=UPI00190AE881|nr:FUSC family protein [Erwinia sp. S43]MBK0035782.1 FUSC family protein [Erwinia sp. S43]